MPFNKLLFGSGTAILGLALLTSPGYSRSEGLPLSSFEPPMTTEFMEGLASRVGCKATSQILAWPASGNLQRAIAELIATSKKQSQGGKSFYTAMREDLFNPNHSFRACRSESRAAEQEAHYGLRQLLGKTRNYNVIFIRVGGFGSHLNETGNLHLPSERIGEWLRAEGETKFRSERFECSNSYADEQLCTPELLEFIQQKAHNPNDRIILWGYSKGSNTSIEALRLSEDLRNRTLALVTLGSPLRGSNLITKIHPLIKEAVRLKQEHRALAEVLVREVLAKAVSSDSWRALYDDLEAVERGARSMLPATRETYLASLPADAFTRNGPPIPVLSFAAILDVSELNVLPTLTIRDDELLALGDSQSQNHFMEFLTTGNFRDYPLADSCVALQHTVLPAIPGLKSELVAVMKMGHTDFRMSEVSAADFPVPVDAIVDTVFEMIAKRLEDAL